MDENSTILMYEDDSFVVISSQLLFTLHIKREHTGDFVVNTPRLRDAGICYNKILTTNDKECLYECLNIYDVCMDEFLDYAG